MALSDYTIAGVRSLEVNGVKYRPADSATAMTEDEVDEALEGLAGFAGVSIAGKAVGFEVKVYLTTAQKFSDLRGLRGVKAALVARDRSFVLEEAFRVGELSADLTDNSCTIRMVGFAMTERLAS